MQRASIPTCGSIRLSDDDVALLKRLEARRESARAAEKSRGQPSLMVPMGRSAYADPLWSY